MLEELLGIDGGNRDNPDSGNWEIKSHTRSAPLTLLHLEAEPRGHIGDMVRAFGWPDKKDPQQTNFRHSIWGKSSRGFRVIGESDRVAVINDHDADIKPYWTHDRLMSAFAAKLRRLIVVTGQRPDKDTVVWQSAIMLNEPKLTDLPRLLESGLIAIDFDARTKPNGAIRNHGTKFRVKAKDLGEIYQSIKPLRVN